LAKIDQFFPGYEYNASTGVCDRENDLSLTGLSYEDHRRGVVYLAIVFSAIFYFALSIMF
jgi:hypothetical protein